MGYAIEEIGFEITEANQARNGTIALAMQNDFGKFVNWFHSQRRSKDAN